MMKVMILLLISLFALVGCDQGLAPPETTPLSSDFPVTPLGGNPVGNWVPRQVEPVEITIIDDSQIPALVDSFVFVTELQGFFRFELSNACSVDVALSINPQVYLQGSTTPIPFAFTDTIRGDGPYYLIEENVLQAPIESTLFDLDTLGFTAGTNSLQLISLPNLFRPLEGVDVQIPVYLIFHLTAAEENPLQKGAGMAEYHRND